MICIQYSLTYILFVNPVLITRMLSSLVDYSVRLTGVLIVNFHVLSIATAKMKGLELSRKTSKVRAEKFSIYFLFNSIYLDRHFCGMSESVIAPLLNWYSVGLEMCLSHAHKTGLAHSF